MKQLATQPRKALYEASTELWNRQALGQRKMAQPVEQEPSVKCCPLSEAYGLA